MLRGLANTFTRLPDWRLMPDPWIRRPLQLLDRMAQDGIDDHDLYYDVILANGKIAAMLDPVQVDALEAAVLGEDEDAGPVPITTGDLRALAARVRSELGPGFAIGVLRSGHSDWIAWLKSHPTRADTVAQEVAYRAAATRVKWQQPGARGWRQRRRPTKAEARRQAQTAPVETSIEFSGDDLRKMTEAQGADLQERKLGIATVLMHGSWEGVEDEGGPLDFGDVHARLTVLGYDGEHEKRIHGPILHDDGSVVQVQADQAYGPAAFGDAVAAWLLEAADEAEVVHGDWLEDEAAPLAATPPGIAATSEAESSTS
jgi:hypothetical protein